MPDDHFLAFAGFPCDHELKPINAGVALVGIPYHSIYPNETAHSAEAPAAIRRESNRYPGDPFAWDFDIGRPLAEICCGKVVDCGDLQVTPNNAVRNREIIKSAISSVINAGAIPIVLGGDDSIPIPVLAAFEQEEPFFVLQLDAHIDWRDEVKGVGDGYSSTMRRASEMPWVKGIVQVGARGVGSARREEYQAAIDYGAILITAKTFHERGIQQVLENIPKGSRCFLTIDFDVLDPSNMPAVGAPTPGGLFFQETIDLIYAVSQHTSLVGVCLVELAPEQDFNNLGVITAMRVVWNVIGALMAQRDKNII